MHLWGREDVDWTGINDAAHFIGTYLRKWGRVPVRDYKEKYGTVRVYCGFGWDSIHDVFYPGYAYIQWPQGSILFKLCYDNTARRVFDVLNYAVRPYHIFLYKRAYKLAIKKWPHLREEILRGADWHELLEGYGWHRVRTGERSYELYLDWHPDHYSAKHPEPEDDGE